MAETHDFPAPDAMRNVTETALMKDLVESLLNACYELLGAHAEAALVISSGSVSPQYAAANIDTEGGTASDDLTHLDQTFLEDGRVLIIRAAHPDRTVVVKHHQGGAGEIMLAGFGRLLPR